METDCVILSKQPYQESALLVRAFSPDCGRLDLIAHGAQKVTETQFPVPGSMPQDGSATPLWLWICFWLRTVKVPVPLPDSFATSTENGRMKKIKS